MNQSQHDELAQLFAQNMQLAQSTQQLAAQQMQLQQPVLVESVPEQQHTVEEKQPEQQAVHFVSSHYTGTTHIRPSDPSSEPSPSPPPPYNEAVMPQAMADMLREHAIDPAALLPNQIHLFQNADYEQRSRLLELWRIAPPSYPLEEHLNGTWVSTSVEREETLARIRYEEQQQELRRHGEEEERRKYKEQQQRQQQQQRWSQPWSHVPPPEERMLEFDTHIPTPLHIPHQAQAIPVQTSADTIPPGRDEVETPISPIREPGESAWPPAARMRASWIASNANSVPSSRPQTRHGEAEPYIVNGYQGQEQRNDPVYAMMARMEEERSQAPSYRQSMEDQYGMMEQIRNHADWERMNERLAREKMTQAQAQAQAQGFRYGFGDPDPGFGADCEMEM